MRPRWATVATSCSPWGPSASAWTASWTTPARHTSPGRSTTIEEDPGVGDLDGLAGQLRAELARYCAALGAEPVPWAHDPRELSYTVGEAVGLDLGERQALLAVPDTAERLRQARDLVRRERRLASSLGVGTGPQPFTFNPN